MTLGTVVFQPGGVDLQGWTKSQTYRLSFTDVAAGGSQPHFSGMGEITAELFGVVFPRRYGDRESVSKIEALAADGKRHTLIRGDGTDLGEWYVQNITEDHRPISNEGDGKQIAYSIRIRKHNLGS